MAKALADERYVALKTLRKSGEAMVTPVWIAGEGDEVFVFTQGDSGKVKRARNNSEVAVAPCSMRGKVKGEWQAGVATVDDSPATLDRVTDMIAKKYGLEFSAFGLFKGKEAMKKGRVIIRVRLNSAV